ncbi:hypothetical protein [Microbulbifer hainanensis]|uniref:hypothetical protein n=1 Tax=Microbulbifer hainanensis TaxID=2735675 RepID=UPI0018662B1F|nr:hypothetical protein [Microbulbifer hainanensis]
MLSEDQAEFCIRSFRNALNAHIGAGKNPNGRNACVLNITRHDGTELFLYAYSSARSLSAGEHANLAAAGFPLVPDVSPALRVYACGGMGQYHTEPRLINFLYASPGYIENVKTALIISEIDCCTTCMRYTIDLFVRANPNVNVFTDEYGKVPGRNQRPRFVYQGPAPLTWS